MTGEHDTSSPDDRPFGPLVFGPVTADEFIAELTAVSTELQGKHEVAHELALLAERIRDHGARGHEIRSLLARARLRLGYAGEDEELLDACGGAVDVAEAARMLGTDADAVQAMIRVGTLLPVRLRGKILLPRLQFIVDGGRTAVMQGIPEIVASAARYAAEGWHVLQWLVLSSSALGGRTPMQALEAGEVAAVIAAAEVEI